MANSLKDTIDDVDAMKQVGGGEAASSFHSLASSASSTASSSATSELQAQAKLNAKKADELAS